MNLNFKVKTKWNVKNIQSIFESLLKTKLTFNEKIKGFAMGGGDTPNETPKGVDVKDVVKFIEVEGGLVDFCFEFDNGEYTAIPLSFYEIEDGIDVTLLVESYIIRDNDIVKPQLIDLMNKTIDDLRSKGLECSNLVEEDE